MLTAEKIVEIEENIIQLDNLNEVLTINLEAYADMQAKGFGCVQITGLMQEKIDYIKSMFESGS